MCDSSFAAGPASRRADANGNKGGRVAIRIKITAVASALLLILSGCASQTSPTWPAGSERIAVKVLGPNIGLNDVPIGTYRVEGSPFVVTVGRTVSKTEGAFGGLGALSAHSSGKDEAKKRLTGHESALQINLASLLETRFKAKIDQGLGSNLLTSVVSGPGMATLELMPFAFLAVRGEQTQLQLVVKARLLNAGGAEQWKTRYIYYHPQHYALIGPGSLTVDNARLLKILAAQAIDETAHVILADTRGAGAVWLNQPVKVTGIFTGIEPFAVEGLLLKKTATTVIFTPKASSAATYAGVNILPAKDVTISTP